MIIAVISVPKLLIGILVVTLSILVLVIAYRKLLQYLGKGSLPKEDYCVLYSVEENPASGEIVFYFVSHSKKKVTLELLDARNEKLVKTLFEAICKVDGNMVRVNSKEFSNGEYIYQLVTNNQKTSKKLTILNV